MTAYTKPDGSEVIVCDTCGLAHDGTRPNVAGLKPVDHGAEMRGYLAELGLDEESLAGADLKIKNHCPECKSKAPQP